MADQINPTGSFASGPVVAISVSGAPRPAPAKASTAQESTPRPALGTGSVAESPATPDAALSQINARLQQAATELKIQVDKGTGRTVYKIVNQGSGEVVLQVPSEEVLAMARNLRAMDSTTGASGVLVDKEG